MSAEHEHAQAESFPRHATRDLIGAHLTNEERRAWIQALAVSLALVLFALAFPTERLTGYAPSLPWQTMQSRLGLQALLPSVAADVLTNRFVHLPASRVWFLLAALGYGASFFVLVRAARGLGWSAAQALFASLLACLAPVAWIAGSNPGVSSFALLGACVLFTALARDIGAGGRTTIVRIALAATLALSLHVQCAWLLPAALLGMRKCGWLGVVLLCAIAGAFAFVTHPARLWFSAGFGAGPGPLLAWSSAWIFALGAASVGLIAALRAVLTGGSSAPELWVIAFALVPLAGFGVLGTLDFDVPYTWLVPVGWLGLLHGFERIDRRGVLVCAGTALLGLALIMLWRRLDPERTWRRAALAQLGPADLVLTASPEHERILRDYHELATFDLRPSFTPSALELALHDAQGRGGRVWLDEDSLWRGGACIYPRLAELEAFVEEHALARLPAREQSGQPLD